MASLSPYPTNFYHLSKWHLQAHSLKLCFYEFKFMGTQVSNHLLPSSRERQTRRSNSSGSRRLNWGSCCTPKFSLPFSQEIPTLGFSQIFKIGSGIDQTDFSLAIDQELGFLSHFPEETEFSEVQLTITCFRTFSSSLVVLKVLIIWDKR